MVMVIWWFLACKRWKAEADRLLLTWASETERRCPHCGQRALVGHGRRRRTVHCGQEPGPRWPVCTVLEFEVQRVRCTRCGKTHTLLPAFVARYQRHSNRVRQETVRLWEAGQSWRALLEGLRPLEVPLRTDSSPRRWVRGIRARLGSAAEALARRLGPADGCPHYGSVAPRGSWAGFAESVREAVAAAGWEEPPAGEDLAAANRLGRGQWAV